MADTLTIVPTWAAVADVIALGLENGTAEGKRLARLELRRMAAAADLGTLRGEQSRLHDLLCDLERRDANGMLDAAGKATLAQTHEAYRANREARRAAFAMATEGGR